MFYFKFSLNLSHFVKCFYHLFFKNISISFKFISVLVIFIFQLKFMLYLMATFLLQFFHLLFTFSVNKKYFW